VPLESRLYVEVKTRREGDTVEEKRWTVGQRGGRGREREEGRGKGGGLENQRGSRM